MEYREKGKQHRVVNRGYDSEDNKYFKEMKDKVLEASKDVKYLMERGYRPKTAANFVVCHYGLNERVRLALTRCCATDESIKSRSDKKVSKESLKGAEIWVDGFNAIIPLESMLSKSVIFKSMDGTVRDLANLAGSYRLIDKTEKAVRLLLEELCELEVKKVNIFLDRPMSNSGRLKILIEEVAEEYNIDTEVTLLNGVDLELYGKENVVSGDCVVIDESISWIPLYTWIVDKYTEDNETWVVDFGEVTSK